MRLYRIIASFEVEAEDEEAACREAMNTVTDDSMLVEAITFLEEYQVEGT